MRPFETPRVNAVPVSGSVMVCVFVYSIDNESQETFTDDYTCLDHEEERGRIVT